MLRIYGVKKTTVFDCLWRVVDAVNRTLVIEFPLRNMDALRVLEAQFRANSTQGVWQGCVGCIDGVHFKMRAPTPGKEVDDPIRYFVPRKGEYALLCIAICDVHRRFTYYSIDMAATTHDSLAWSSSSLGVLVNNGALPRPFFLNGDSAFSLSNHMVVPTGGADPNFDYVQSSNRMPIECAFGMLAKRWGILWRPLVCGFHRRAPLIGCLMRLHNFCIDHNVPDDELVYMFEGCNIAPVQPYRWAMAPEFDKEGRPVHLLDTTADSEELIDTFVNHSIVRDKLIERVNQVGITRPPLAPRLVSSRRGRAIRNRRRAGHAT